MQTVAKKYENTGEFTHWRDCDYHPCPFLAPLHLYTDYWQFFLKKKLVIFCNTSAHKKILLTENKITQTFASLTSAINILVHTTSSTHFVHLLKEEVVYTTSCNTKPTVVLEVIQQY